jgi:hypothetical protein
MSGQAVVAGVFSDHQAGTAGLEKLEAMGRSCARPASPAC